MANPADYTHRLFTVGYGQLYKNAYDLIEGYIADGTPATASLLRRAFDSYTDELHAIAVRMAELAHETIRYEEESSRVRPDSQSTGPRLGSWIGTSHPLPAIPGAVGVNHEPTLKSNGVGWWWTNEEGYSGHIGRWLVGTFQPGSVSPSHTMRRAQGGFKGYSMDEDDGPPDPGEGGRVPPHGQITEPIPARGFVLRGKNIVAVRWHAEIQAARRKFMAELGRINAMADKERDKAIRRKRRGRP